MKKFVHSALVLGLLVSASQAFAFARNSQDLCGDIQNDNVSDGANVLKDASPANGNIMCNYDYSNNSPLALLLASHQSANPPTANAVAFVPLLAKNGESVNEVIGTNQSPNPNESLLAFAIQNEPTLDLASALLTAGATPGVVCTNCDANMTYDYLLARQADGEWIALFGNLLTAGMNIEGKLVIDDLNAPSSEWVKTANAIAAKVTNQPLFDENLAYKMASGSDTSPDMIAWAIAHGLSFNTVPNGQTMTAYQQALESQSLATVTNLLAQTGISLQSADVLYAMNNTKDSSVLPYVISAAPGLAATDPTGQTPLMIALGNPNKFSADIVTELLAKKPDLTAERQQEPSTALEIAASLGNSIAVQQLIQAGANPDQVDTIGGETALMAAIGAGQDQMALYLAGLSKATINQVDASGDSALLLASKKGESGVLTALLSVGGANVNAQDASGNTLLIDAVTSGNLPTVLVLLGNGACIKLINSTGHTALGIAIDGSETDIIAILQQALTKPGQC